MRKILFSLFAAASFAAGVAPAALSVTAVAPAAVAAAPAAHPSMYYG